MSQKLIRRNVEETGIVPGMWLWVQYDGGYHGGILREYENKRQLYIDCDDGKIPFIECTDICINYIIKSHYVC